MIVTKTELQQVLDQINKVTAQLDERLKKLEDKQPVAKKVPVSKENT